MSASVLLKFIKRVGENILTHTSNAKSDLTFNISFIISLIVTKFEHKKNKLFLNSGALLFSTNIAIMSPSMLKRARGPSKKIKQ